MIKTNRGMTFVELLFASTILVSVVGASVTTHAMILRMYRNAQVEASLFAEGLYTMDMIQRGDEGLYGVHKARASTVLISVDQRQIDFLADQNDEYTPTTADDVVMSIYFDNGDGDDTTFEDNTIMLDSGAQTIVLGRSIEDIAFSQTGNLITVDLTVTENVRGDLLRLTFSRDMLIRN